MKQYTGYADGEVPRGIFDVDQHIHIVEDPHHLYLERCCHTCPICAERGFVQRPPAGQGMPPHGTAQLFTDPLSNHLPVIDRRVPMFYRTFGCGYQATRREGRYIRTSEWRFGYGPRPDLDHDDSDTVRLYISLARDRDQAYTQDFPGAFLPLWWPHVTRFNDRNAQFARSRYGRYMRTPNTREAGPDDAMRWKSLEPTEYESRFVGPWIDWPERPSFPWLMGQPNTMRWMQSLGPTDTDGGWEAIPAPDERHSYGVPAVRVSIVECWERPEQGIEGEWQAMDDYDGHRDAGGYGRRSQLFSPADMLHIDHAWGAFPILVCGAWPNGRPMDYEPEDVMAVHGDYITRRKPPNNSFPRLDPDTEIRRVRLEEPWMSGEARYYTAEHSPRADWERSNADAVRHGHVQYFPPVVPVPDAAGSFRRK